MYIVLGPEWIWPIGYYLRAYLVFGEGTEEDRLLYVHALLDRYRDHIARSEYRALPELTNKVGGVWLWLC